MLEQTKNKYLNELLAKLEKRVALKEAEALSLFRSMDATLKEKAMAKAVAKESRSMYMEVRKILFLCVPFTKENIDSPLLSGSSPNSNPSLSPDQDALERAALDLIEFREIIKITEAAQVLQLRSPNSGSDSQSETLGLINKLGTTLPATLRTALETVAKYGILRDIIDLDKILALPSKFSMPRGNSTKGGMVKKLITLGYTKDTANIVADKLIATGETSVYSANLSSSNAVQSALRPYEMSAEAKTVLKQMNTEEQNLKDQNLLDVLAQPELEPELETDLAETGFEANF